MPDLMVKCVATKCKTIDPCGPNGLAGPHFNIYSRTSKDSEVGELIKSAKMGKRLFIGELLVTGHCRLPSILHVPHTSTGGKM